MPFGSSSQSWAGVNVNIKVSMPERLSPEPKWSGEMAPVSLPV